MSSIGCSYLCRVGLEYFVVNSISPFSNLFYVIALLASSNLGIFITLGNRCVNFKLFLSSRRRRKKNLPTFFVDGACSLRSSCSKYATKKKMHESIDKNKCFFANEPSSWAMIWCNIGKKVATEAEMNFSS